MLTVVGRGADFAEAIARAYAGVAADFVRRHAVPARHRTQSALLDDRTMKYSVVTFGCRVNQADSLGFEEELRARGASPVVAAKTPTSWS